MKLKREKENFRIAGDLAKFLVERDTSWEISYSAADRSKPKSTSSSQGQIEDLGETPLVLATNSGCVETMEEILNIYPEAVEHDDDEGRNILHVAIKYLQLKISESL
ncbi:conserved hypothetical protein [Ricinus communis]|uniref:Uncharacterized protein n=1 Tax=Ricinus communis TaxID=3988 RepID=B9SK88_RICCO|nr:conserved hypothetical protein [Ricinus communis]